MRPPHPARPRGPTTWWPAPLPFTGAFLIALAGAPIHATPSVLAQGTASGAVEVREAWTRAVPAGAPTAVGYLVLRNAGAASDRLVASSSPAAERVEIHEAHVEDGIARMRPVPGGVPLPSGGTVRFEPSGLHLMLVRPRGALRPGERVPVVLTFERAGTVQTELAVAAPGARSAPHDAAGHEGHRR